MDEQGLVFGRLKSRLLNLEDWAWDTRLGVRTFGYFPASGGQDRGHWFVHYTPTAYAELFRLLNAAQLRPDDVFVDIGSGMGRGVFAAAFMGARAAGIERVAGLMAAAERNKKRCKLDRTKITFQNIDATLATLADATVIFMFHPFGEATMRKVLDNLYQQRQAAGAKHPVRIIYYNPVFNDIMNSADWLESIASLPCIPARWANAGRYQATIWRSKDGR